MRILCPTSPDRRVTITMDIHTNNYRIAPLDDKQEVLQLLKQAEATIAEMTGRDVTLIAYERNDDAEQSNPT